MNILTAYYYTCADMLKKYIPYVPELKLTNAKGYYGKIHRENGEFKYISLSKFNLDCGCTKWDQEDFDDLINTICHEFAHMFYWEHGIDHTELTATFEEFIKAELNIREANRKLDLINKKLGVA